MSANKLVRMANQIGTFFAHMPPETAQAAIAEHLRKFWDPRMRAQLVASVASGEAGLQPNVHQAVMSLRAIQPPI